MHQLKAIGLLLVIGLVWLAALVLTWRGWYQILVTLLALYPHPELRLYRYNLWIAQDQDINTLLLGNPDITISSKVGYLASQGSKTAQTMATVIDLLFYLTVGQKNHCAASIEQDETHRT